MALREIDYSRVCPVRVPHGRDVLKGELMVPTVAAGVVVIAHDEEPGHRSSSQLAASVLHEARLATLRLNLSQPTSEGPPGHRPGDVEQMAGRMVAATDWLAGERRTCRLPLGYLGAGAEAGAALVAAARRAGRVQAVVSRGGHPDLARESLAQVKAPTLLLVGELDDDGLERNLLASRQIQSRVQVTCMPGTTRGFEEPGAQRIAARLAREWFKRTLDPGY